MALNTCQLWSNGIKIDSFPKKSMGTAALFTSAATFSIAVAAAPLLFSTTSDKPQRSWFFLPKKRQRFSALF